MLIFPDEMESHRFPALTRMGAPGGPHPHVPTPGRNQKQGGYEGGEDATGKLTYTVAAPKCGTASLASLAVRLRPYGGRKIRLVGDTGRFHTTTAVPQFLLAHQEQLEIYGLPPYCPSLNLIERWWGHLKGTGVAHVLSAPLDDLAPALRRGGRRVSGHRDRRGCMFTHEDDPGARPRPSLKLAA